MPSKNFRAGSTKPAARKSAAVSKPVVPAIDAVSPAKAALAKPKLEQAKTASVQADAAVPFLAQSAEPAVAAKPIERVSEVVTAAASPIAIEMTETPAETIAKMAEPITETVEKETQTMQNTIENTMNPAQAQAGAQALFGDMNDRAKGAMEKTAKMAEEMNDFAKGNIEAMVESSRIAAKGMESIGQEAAEFTRKSFEQATATMKTMASVKSPTELFKLQSDFMRSTFDMYVAEASKTTEQMMKLAGDAAQPLSNRVAVAADKAKVAA